MRTRLLFICLFCLSLGATAQIEIPRTTNTGPIIKAEESNSTGFPILKREETETESRFLKEKPKAIDLRENPNGLMTEADVMKKKWSKDKEIREEYRKDQSLGNVVTKGRFVEVYCRDHQYIDGDKVQIIVNGELVAASVSLHAGFQPILVTLQDGFNSIQFVALNQGSSGPNTAELRVLSEKGEQIAVKEWNLLTGAKAELIVVKN
ncbi:hypothetical protein C8P64_1645 [Christiangramia gaetbulicola]|uniref:Secreted protein n=1 Tax=Christiangramia gaetbulicola TaxID=703340 RepID=A0A2T6AH39_9FLAO|nr:hypothetical protein [Christiangramia gaetbulicola]PTX43119.1 hypothetical protein C8P64_1645 [Christiangramia gaetbulicola]